MSAWVCMSCHERFIGSPVPEGRTPESRQCHGCLEGRLCYFTNHDLAMESRLDFPELAKRLHEVDFQMERFHRINHDAQPTDWRFCSAEPCIAIYALWRELDETMEVPPGPLQL